MSHHRIGFTECISSFDNFFQSDSKSFCQLLLLVCTLGYKLMKRRIKKSECDRLSVHCFKCFLHVLFGISNKFIQGLTALTFICTEYHFSQQKQWSFRIFSVEHMFGPEQSYAFCSKIQCNPGIFRCFSIGTDTHRTVFVNKCHEFPESWIFRCINKFHGTGINISFCSVKGQNITFLDNEIRSAYFGRFAVDVNSKGSCTHDAAFAPAACHKCRM